MGSVMTSSSVSSSNDGRPPARRASSLGFGPKEGSLETDFRRRYSNDDNDIEQPNHRLPYPEELRTKKKGDSFPLKLHRMLSESSSEKKGESVAAWKEHGRAFSIYNEEKFVQTLLPKYFRQTKVTSFYRQLSRYGFSRLKRGVDSGAFFHVLFLRGMPFLCDSIVSIKIEGRSNSLKSAFPPDCELDFYSMTPVEEISSSFASWNCRNETSKDNKMNGSTSSCGTTSTASVSSVEESVRALTTSQVPSSEPSNSTQQSEIHDKIVANTCSSSSTIPKSAVMGHKASNIAHPQPDIQNVLSNEDDYDSSLAQVLPDLQIDNLLKGDYSVSGIGSFAHMDKNDEDVELMVMEMEMD